MIVKCIANTGSNLSKESLAIGESANTQFPIEIGEIYTVYAISVWRNIVNYLVDISSPAASSRPNWNPAQLFEIVEKRIPPGWQFDFREHIKDYPLIVICGYPELLDEQHYDGLIEYEEQAMYVWLKRKQEIDRWVEGREEDDWDHEQ